MRTEKFISVVLAGVTAVGLLAGCGSANNTSSAGGGSTSSTSTTQTSQSEASETVQWQRRKVWKRQRAERREQKK